MIFELAGVPEPLAREAMRLAAHKLPVKTKFVLREGAISELEAGPGSVKSREAHDLADPQLVDAVGNARQEIFNLRFQHATGQLEDTAALSGRSVTSRAPDRRAGSAESTWSAS